MNSGFLDKLIERIGKVRSVDLEAYLLRLADEISMNDTKFCTGCQMTRPKEGGIMKKSGKVNRWQCKPCQEKKSFSPYTKKETNESSHA